MANTTQTVDRARRFTRRALLNAAAAAAAMLLIAVPRLRAGGDMDIKRNGAQPSGKGPAEWFTYKAGAA